MLPTEHSYWNGHHSIRSSQHSYRNTRCSISTTRYSYRTALFPSWQITHSLPLVVILNNFISSPPVFFNIYDMDKDGYISNGELFQVLKMMVGSNLRDTQLQQIVDKTITNADTDLDGRISYEEFCAVSITIWLEFFWYLAMQIKVIGDCPFKNKNQVGREVFICLKFTDWLDLEIIFSTQICGEYKRANWTI